KTLEEMLERGEIDALMSVMIPKGLGTSVKRLFPNFREVELAYYRKTRIFPIMHTFVLRKAIYDANPWLAVSLYRAFLRARDMAQRHMYDTDALTVSLPWVIDEIERGREIPWDYSIAGSRPTLEALVQYLDEQQLTRRRVDVAELFAPELHGGARLVFRDRDRADLRAVHAREGDEIRAGIDDRDVQLPAALVRLGDRGIDRRLRALERDRRAVRNVVRHLVGHHVHRVGLLRLLCARGERESCDADCESCANPRHG